MYLFAVCYCRYALIFIVTPMEQKQIFCLAINGLTSDVCIIVNLTSAGKRRLSEKSKIKLYRKIYKPINVDRKII